MLRHYERRAGDGLVFFDDAALTAMATGQALEMTSNAVWVMLHRGREAVARCVRKRLAAAGDFR